MAEKTSLNSIPVAPKDSIDADLPTGWQDFQTVYSYLNLCDELPEHADAIVVGGAGSRVDMAECASRLYFLGLSPIIVVSGFRHPDFKEAEANLLGDRLLELGVPAEAILRDPKAANTGENILFSAALLADRGIYPKTVILVHRPFMSRRFKATAEAQWPSDPKPKFYATSADYNFCEYYEIDQGLGLYDRMLWSMLGDYERITTYAEKGWQTPQPVSPEAEAAYQRLLARGYSPR
ncbi:YdcF family protein [Candidatus Saccharibacteria bacterium]|nr:YdcF family protein [Candidatus Saccharibacteria bacterium]